MTDEKETPAEPGISPDAFAAMYEENMGEAIEAPAEAHPEPASAQGSSQETLDPEPRSAQDDPVDPPVTGFSLADAADEIRRSGLPPAVLKGKSEDQLIALGQDLSTKRRDRDREHTARQTQETNEGSPSATPDEAAKPVGAGGEAEAGNPTEAEEAEEFAELELDLGEKAARLVLDSRREARAAAQRAEALAQRFEQSEQERQASAVSEQTDKVLDGLGSEYPDLSKSKEKREAVIARAVELSQASQERYMGLPEADRLPTILKEAVLLELGTPSGPPPTRRTVAPAAADVAGTHEAEAHQGEVGRRTFDSLYRKHMA